MDEQIEGPAMVCHNLVVWMRSLWLTADFYMQGNGPL